MLGSSQDSKLKIFVLTLIVSWKHWFDKYALVNMQMSSWFSIEPRGNEIAEKLHDLLIQFGSHQCIQHTNLGESILLIFSGSIQGTDKPNTNFRILIPRAFAWVYRFLLQPTQELTLEKHDFEPFIWPIRKIFCLWEDYKFSFIKYLSFK